MKDGNGTKQSTGDKGSKPASVDSGGGAGGGGGVADTKDPQQQQQQQWNQKVLYSVALGLLYIINVLFHFQCIIFKRG